MDIIVKVERRDRIVFVCHSYRLVTMMKYYVCAVISATEIATTETAKRK